MSFSVRTKELNYEYGSTGILSITNNLKNIFYKKFWIMIFDIIKFYKLSKKFLNNKKIQDLTLENYLKRINLVKYLLTLILFQCVVLFGLLLLKKF